ncbi:MAG: type IV pilus biogenesis/stability protein PilW [Pseudomonadota bacterium]
MFSKQSRSLKLLIFISMVFMTGCASVPDSGLPSSQARTPKSDKALIHAKLARGYLQQQQYAVAKTELEKALSIDSSHSESNYVMALLLLELKQYGEAQAYFEQAVESDRSNSAAAHDYGVYLCQIGRERESINYFEIATSNPLFERAELSYMRAGECLAKTGDQRAESYLRQALSINPQLRPALFRLARLNYDAGQFLSARAYIERYLSITKAQPASLLLAYRIESSSGAADVAETYRKRLLENYPGSKEAAQLRKSGR